MELSCFFCHIDICVWRFQVCISIVDGRSTVLICLRYFKLMHVLIYLEFFNYWNDVETNLRFSFSFFNGKPGNFSWSESLLPRSYTTMHWVFSIGRTQLTHLRIHLMCFEFPTFWLEREHLTTKLCPDPMHSIIS